MNNTNVYTGTGFSHDIPFSDYAMLSVEDILDKYNDTNYISTQTGICSHVQDGDTLKININNEDVWVRLVGINTPEQDTNGYLCSKKFVEKLCLNQTIGLKIDSQKEQDNYGRTLGVVIVNGKNLNEILLKEGLAEIMYIPPSEFLPSDWINNNNEKTFITIDKNISDISMKKSPFSFDEDNKIEIKEKNLTKNTSLNQNFILDETNWNFPEYDYGGSSSISQINFNTENNNENNTDFSLSGQFYGLLNLPTNSTRWILKFDFKIHNFSALQMNAAFAFGGNDATVLAPYEYGKKSLSDPLCLKFSSESNPHNDQDFSIISSTTADENIISQGNFYQMMIIRWDNNCILVCNNQYMINVPLNADALNIFGFNKRKTGGALTIRNLSLFDISHQEEVEEEQETEDICDNPINLQSTIVNQKKKLFLYVTQSKNLVWPNTEYNYQVYVKNISGQNIENVKIYITNPKEVVIPEKKNQQSTYTIPSLKTGQSILLNVNNCTIMQEGYYHVNFVAMGDETEIKTQTLLVKCGYENDNKNTMHRIAFYNFSPYEDAYMQRASNFSEDVIQLTKVQTKPFEAYNQPFEMDELELDLYAQDIFLTNTDDMPSMYLGRENWESNLQEYFTGETLMNLIKQINQKSNLVDIDFLRVGTNEMQTDLQRIYPNGFIHRFGLIKSEFYKLLGIIPKIYSINDDLFRWARDETEPEIYPKRENDKWNQKPWCGTGYYVYEYEIENDKRLYHTEKAIFSTEEDAQIYVDDLITFNELHFIDNISYTIIKRDWLPGIFYVEIPIKDIPSNFFLPSVDQVQAIIELSKPYGLKGYPRFMIEDSFMHKMHFSSVPEIIPHINIDLGEYLPINSYIRQKKYQNTANGIQLLEYGKQFNQIGFETNIPSFFSYYPLPSICRIITKDIRYFMIDHKPYVYVYEPQYYDYFTYVNPNEEYFVQINIPKNTYGSVIVALNDNIIIDDIIELNTPYTHWTETDNNYSYTLNQSDMFYLQDLNNNDIILFAFKDEDENIIAEKIFKVLIDNHIITLQYYQDNIPNDIEINVSQEPHIIDESDYELFQDNVGTDIEVMKISKNELIQLLNDNHIQIEGVIVNHGLNNEETLSQYDFCSNNNSEDILVVINKHDNSISVDMKQETRIKCNQGQKSFDGKKVTNNSIDKLLMKNPEDISFYIEDTNQFAINDVQPELNELEIPVKYKTLNYYNADTSMLLDLEKNREEPSAIKIIKQNLPLHVNINLLISNADKNKDFIISYKKLYDDIYQISYKTYKNKEVVIKEIVTQFDYILCELSNVSSNRDLIKIYYALNDKLYFITAFSANILANNGYQVRVSLTNDLTLSSKFSLSTGNILFGDMRYSISNNIEEYHDWYLSNKQYSDIISTDNYTATERVKSNLNWYKLYKINKDETSFTTFENTIDEKTTVNDIQLYFNNLNIPKNSIIDKVYLDLYTDSREEIPVTASYQLNANAFTQNDNGISGIFDISSYNIYTEYNLKYLYKQLRYYQEKENEEQIEYYKTLINDNAKYNKNISIDFSKDNPIIIKDSYWNEVGFDENTSTLLSSDVKMVYLIIEGYNHSHKTPLEVQLVHYDGVAESKTIEINAGYFYKKIPVNYNAKYNIETLSIRFRFNNTIDNHIQQVDLYNVKSQIQFTNTQEFNKPLIEGETILINGLNKYAINVCEDIDGDKVQNGLNIILSFGDIQNYIKIYSAVVNIIYHEKAFTNIFETAPDFNVIAADMTDNIVMSGCIFDEKISDMRQDSYTMKKPNGEYDAGFEMNHRIYQAFTAEEDNITSIELKFNGRIGAPDNYLKISILDNYENLPNNVLKEVVVNIAKTQPIDGEAYKFNICVNDLVIGDTYWFSIEPVDKTKQGARRLLYNHYQINDNKLLSVINGDIINQHASLYFRLYSKENKYSFKDLPFAFELQDTYTKDINLITELQILDGTIKNFTESLFEENLCIQQKTDESGDTEHLIENSEEESPDDNSNNNSSDIIGILTG